MRRPMRDGNCAYHARFPSDADGVVIRRTPEVGAVPEIGIRIFGIFLTVK